MQRLALTIISMLLAGSAFSADAVLEVNSQETADAVAAAAAGMPAIYKGQPLLLAPMFAAPQGLLADFAAEPWTHVPGIKLGQYRTGEAAEFSTEARVFCTDKALYIGVRCDEPDMEGLVVEQWNPFGSDGVELFLYPGEDVRGKNYYEMVVDTSNQSKVANLHVYSQAGKRTAGDAIAQVVAQTRKADKYWVAEYKIAYSELGLSPESMTKSALWRLDIIRNRPAHDADEERARISWAPTHSPRNHVPAKMGYVMVGALTRPEFAATVAARAREAAGKPALPAGVSADVESLVKHLRDADRKVWKDAQRSLLAMGEKSSLYAQAVLDALSNGNPEHDRLIAARMAPLETRCQDIADYADDPLPPELADTAPPRPDLDNGDGDAALAAGLKQPDEYVALLAQAIVQQDWKALVVAADGVKATADPQRLEISLLSAERDAALKGLDQRTFWTSREAIETWSLAARAHLGDANALQTLRKIALPTPGEPEPAPGHAVRNSNASRASMKRKFGLVCLALLHEPGIEEQIHSLCKTSLGENGIVQANNGLVDPLVEALFVADPKGAWDKLIAIANSNDPDVSADIKISVVGNLATLLAARTNQRRGVLVDNALACELTVAAPPHALQQLINPITALLEAVQDRQQQQRQFRSEALRAADVL